MSLEVGTEVTVMKGKTPQRWQITHPLEDRGNGSRPCYGMRRWVQKNNKWSSNSYCIAAERIVQVIDGN